ncbi:MAG TPA: Hpt domain-containing protein [Wenzhouxiangellaceae bacterium]|nr:Hpt domain-containing protein [Wenzhouxiangellaceae bacterium]
MNSSSAARAQGIQWTRPYLVALCDEIRQALEAWAGEPDATAPDLDQARAASRKLAATLEALDVAGAAALADSLGRALQAIDQPDPETAMVLLESIAILPDYLERLETGAPDTPEVLADFIDRTHAAAGLEPVAKPAAVTGIEVLNDDGSGDYVPLNAEELRRTYQRALRDWLKDSSDIDGLVDFTLSLQHAPSLQLRRLGKVAEAVFKGLAGGQLKPGPQIQAHLASLDQLLRRLGEDGEDDSVLGHADKVTLALVGDLHAAAPGCAEIDRLRSETYKREVDQLDLERARSVLSGRNRELFTAIAEAARGELNQAKETLNEFLLGHKAEGRGITEQAGLLRSVADSLGMLGLDRLKQRVRQQADRLGELTADPENPVLLDVARELLLVESELDESVLYLGEAPESDLLEGDGQHLPKAEHRRVMRQVLREALDDLGQAKHLLDQVHRGQANSDSVEQSIRILGRVGGVLHMAGQPIAAEMLEASAACIGDEMRDGATDDVDEERLEGLAEALVVVEFYLDSLTRLDDRGAEYLHDARNRLIGLGYLGESAAPSERAEPEVPLPAEAEASNEVEEPAPVEQSAESDEEALSIDFGEAAKESTEAETGARMEGMAALSESQDAGIDDEEPLSIEFESTSDEPEAPEGLESDEHRMHGESEQDGKEPSEQSALPESGVLDSDDFDLMSIFLEEFDEELASLQRGYPEWRSRLTDQSLLTDIRRSFHTLKGSGRMAGADRIGEFAWQVEQLLNQTLDGQYSAEQVADLVGEAIEALPSLRAALVGDMPELDQDDVDSLLGRIAGIGEESDLPELEGLDPTLVQLMVKEIKDHLETIDRWIETSRRQGWPADVDRDLIRAVHTIKGTLRLAPIGDEADSLQLIEEYLQEVLDTDSEPGEASVELMEDLRSLLGKRLDRLQRRAVSTDHFNTAPLASQARSLISALHREVEHGETAQAPEAPEAEAPEAEVPEEEALEEEAPEEEAPEEEAPEEEVPEEEVPEEEVPEEEVPEEIAREVADTPVAAVGVYDIQYSDLDSELLELFAEEGQELLEHSDGLLQQWRENPEDRQLVTALQRDIHTIKGSARMAGLNPVGEVAHVLEDLLENIAGGRQKASAASIDTMEAGCDQLHAMLDAVEKRQPLPGRGALEELAAEEQAQTEEEPAAARTELEAAGVERTGRSSTIRLASEQVEELLNFAGEVSIFRSRIEQEIGAFRGNIGEVEQTVARLREQLRKLEQETEAQILSRYEREHGSSDSTFDPLELDRYSTIQQLSRALAESVSDLNSLTELMDDAGRQSETLLMQQARVNTELQEGLMQARMVSFNTLAPRLRRVVRNAARDIGRKANLEIILEGEGELDRNVLDRVTAPIEHILRNAVAHGIEPPSARQSAGKPEAGTIAITIDREATELLIRVSDDGAGLNLDRIRERALEMSLLTKEQAADPAQLSQIIFHTGFSTAYELSELAGRGVGMDVVSSEVRQIGGRISVDSTPGKGARFTLRIPLSLAVMQAIFVHAGERVFAIPLQAVRGVARIRPAEWREALDSDGTYRYGGDEFPLIELDPQLGFEPVEVGDESLSLLMISTGDQRAAIRVADIQGHREVVLKPVGPQISSIPGILGGTIMGDGQVVVLLDMAPLIERALAEHRLPGMVEVETVEIAEEEVKRTPLVMVVDDSITMRRVTARILEHYGLEVITARDGVEAVDMLFERVPDLMLLDIEMPRMDGFELAAYVRDDTRLAHVPIMMITSRSGDKHRQHARELGVNRYLIKPYQEANMVRNVFEMLEMPVPGDEE